ncbi:hypothetical protein [Undibacterium sp.]|uniref:hypothetical protein n=1 Tax=Undibacterium sp. TaxID=1914977 RepID=UPI0037517901
MHNKSTDSSFTHPLTLINSMELKYTETEAQHLIAREVAKQRMADLERMITEGERRSVQSMAELKVQIANLALLIKEQSVAMEKQNDTLKKEIEKDFATKLEVNDLSNKVESDFDKLNTKIDSMWGKLTIIVSTISAVGLVIQYFLGFHK